MLAHYNHICLSNCYDRQISLSYKANLSCVKKPQDGIVFNKYRREVGGYAQYRGHDLVFQDEQLSRGLFWRSSMIG